MICSNVECSKEFDPKTHNQKYCTDECCRIATNRKIMEKYYEKKKIRSGKLRICKKCDTRLSRYNETNLCSKCEKNKKIQENDKKKILEMLDEIS